MSLLGASWCKGNETHFQGIPGFVAIGIRPLSYEESFVTPGNPDPWLGDNALFFVAKRMQLECEKVKTPFSELIEKLGMKRTVPRNEARNERCERVAPAAPATLQVNGDATAATSPTRMPVGTGAPLAALGEQEFVAIPSNYTAGGPVSDSIRSDQVCADYCGWMASECERIRVGECIYVGRTRTPEGRE